MKTSDSTKNIWGSISEIEELLRGFKKQLDLGDDEFSVFNIVTESIIRMDLLAKSEDIANGDDSQVIIQCLRERLKTGSEALLEKFLEDNLKLQELGRRADMLGQMINMRDLAAETNVV